MESKATEGEAGLTFPISMPSGLAGRRDKGGILIPVGAHVIVIHLINPHSGLIQNACRDKDTGLTEHHTPQALSKPYFTALV